MNSRKSDLTWVYYKTHEPNIVGIFGLTKLTLKSSNQIIGVWYKKIHKDEGRPEGQPTKPGPHLTLRWFSHSLVLNFTQFN